MGDQRAQQQVFTPSGRIHLSSNLEKNSRRGGLWNQGLGPSKQSPGQREPGLQDPSDF